MFPVQSTCCKVVLPCCSVLRMSICKHLLKQTLYQLNKTISTTQCLYPVNEKRSTAYNLISGFHREHSPLMNTEFKNPSCMYSSGNASPDVVSNYDKPTSGSPISIRRERLESQALFRSILSDKGDLPLTAEIWSQIEQKFTQMLKESWEIFCMHTLYVDKNVTAGKSLINYLTSKNVDLNPVVLTFYIGLLGETANGNVEQENEMISFFNLLKSKLELFDAASIEVLVSGFCKTNYYLECLPFLDMYKDFNSLGPPIICNMLEAGLKYKNVDFINMAISEFNSGDICVSQLTHHVPRLIETCFTSGNTDGFEMLMNLLQTHRLLLPKPSLEKIVELYNRFQPGEWTMRFGQLHQKSGACRVCQMRMKEIDVSDADFSAIRNAFLQQVIIGKNVFYKSTPAEVKAFDYFVKARGPFDVVIDGLNVLFKGQRPLSKTRLDTVLSHFLKQKKKVLLLGNKMLPKYLPSGSRPGLHVFQSDTTKADDVFYLYAALYSGKDCLIVTSDKLRDHKFLLQKDLRASFHKWLQRVQIHHWMITDENEFIILRRDLFDIGPARDVGGWHFPVNDVDKKAPFGSLGVLCLRHKGANLSDRQGSEEQKRVTGADKHDARRQKLPMDSTSQDQNSARQLTNNTVLKQKKPNVNTRKPEKKENLKWYEM